MPLKWNVILDFCDWSAGHELVPKAGKHHKVGRNLSVIMTDRGNTVLSVVGVAVVMFDVPGGDPYRVVRRKAS